MTERMNTSQPPGTSVRRWLVIGVAGLLIVLALPSLWDVWQIDRAGIALNRAIVTGAGAAAQLRADQAGGDQRAG